MIQKIPVLAAGIFYALKRSMESMNTIIKWINAKPAIVLLLLFNAIVLLGQLWPEGAPPFAGAVNILTLLFNLIFLLLLLFRGNR